MKLSKEYFLNWLLRTRLTDFGFPQHIFPGVSASCAPMPIGHSNRLQVFLDSVPPTHTRPSSSTNPAYPLIKYPSRRSILLHSDDMAESALPVDINTLSHIYVVKELIQLTIGSNAKIIANPH